MKSVMPQLIACLLMILPAQAAELDSAVFKIGNRILFQGDSITDGGRGRKEDPNHILGHSYAFLIAANYGAAFPERKLEFFNRGVSGNKVPDLLNRWQTNTVDLAPSVVSILIGVNDVWHPLFYTNGVFSAVDYERSYDELLAQTVAALPKVKIILLEPFVAKGKSTSNDWDVWKKQIKEAQAVVERLGAKYKAPVVKLQRVFDEACKRAPTEYWIWDGVHPTYAGHQLIADEWVRVASQTWPAR